MLVAAIYIDVQNPKQNKTTVKMLFIITYAPKRQARWPCSERHQLLGKYVLIFLVIGSMNPLCAFRALMVLLGVLCNLLEQVV